jgi:hypothetical protein
MKYIQRYKNFRKSFEVCHQIAYFLIGALPTDHRRVDVIGRQSRLYRPGQPKTPKKLILSREGTACSELSKAEALTLLQAGCGSKATQGGPDNPGPHAPQRCAADRQIRQQIDETADRRSSRQ